MAEQVVDAGVRIGGLEQAADRVAGPRGGVEGAGVLAQARVAVERLGGGDGEQLPAALVQDSDVRKKGSRRPPKRLRERRTPLAIAPTRPRWGV